MKAISLLILFSILMAVKVSAYDTLAIEGQSPNKTQTQDLKAKIFEIDDDGMGPIIPKEYERSRYPASIPSDDENGHTHDSDGKYKRPFK
ncbi:hypothetical protein ABMA70_02595 [Halobacteriovorax sp. XZX-3]|uniref:hypothetical protein n=1 Tax=unclassified Halobacteriovorax TaxID=2639665 RepID=UPI00371FCEF9